MLQESITAPDLGGADELPAVHEDLAADGGCKAGRWMGGWADGRMGRREHCVDAKRAQCSPESRVDLAVGLPKRTEQCDGRSHRVGDFVLMPHSVSTGGPAHDRNVAKRVRLIPSQRECGRVPAIEAEIGAAMARDFFQQRFVHRHVVFARPPHRIDAQVPRRPIRPSARQPVRPQRTPPPADRCTPGCDRRRRRRSG